MKSVAFATFSINNHVAVNNLFLTAEEPVMS